LKDFILQVLKTLDSKSFLIPWILNNHPDLQDDYDVVLEIISKDGNFLEILNNNMKENPIIVYLACKKSGIGALAYASKALLADKTFIELLIKDRHSFSDWELMTRYIDASIKDDFSWWVGKRNALLDVLQSDEEKKEFVRYLGAGVRHSLNWISDDDL